MKKITKALMLVFLFTLACSSSDDSSDSETNLSTTNSFKANVDGTEYVFNTFFAFKTHDNYEVLGTNENQVNFYLKFNQNGVLDRAHFYSTDFNTNIDFTSSYYNAKSNFTLENLTFDMSQNIVNASFNGTIFEDDIDVSSESKQVQSGSFNLIFTENQADANIDEYIDATINGTLYESIKHGRSGGLAGNTIYQLFGVSDNEIVISIDLDSDTVQEGTFSFTSSSTINRVSVEIVDPFNENNDFEVLSVTGTITINNIIDGFNFDIVQGSFTATASSDDGTVYSIESGIFNLSF